MASPSAAGKVLRWRLRVCWQQFLTRHFRYRGQYLVGRDLPDVIECHNRYVEGHLCPQDDGSHVHPWVRCIVTDKLGVHPQEATRCVLCGARKCDVPGCDERRHHIGPHHTSVGFEQVGS